MGVGGTRALAHLYDLQWLFFLGSIWHPKVKEISMGNIHSLSARLMRTGIDGRKLHQNVGPGQIENIYPPVVCYCFPLSPHLCACAGWCVRLPRSCLLIVSLHWWLCWMVSLPYPPSRGLVSHCVPTRVPVLDGVPAFPRSCPPLVSHCLPSCFRVLDGVSAFQRFCLPCLPACLPDCLPAWITSCLRACLPTCLSSSSPSDFAFSLKQCTARGS